MMAMINTKAVHRSNQLLNYAYGRDFVYDEMMMTGSGPAGEKRAKALARREAIQNALIEFAPTRALIRRFVLPNAGQGPSSRPATPASTTSCSSARRPTGTVRDPAPARRPAATVGRVSALFECPVLLGF
jgi:short subunit dehydrogenase-like uncharacterized protein